MLADSSISDLVETEFYISYYLHLPISEIDSMTTYEFHRYATLTAEQVKSDREYQLELAKTCGYPNILG